MTDLEQPHLFCFGLGYSVLNFARKKLNEGWRISGTCRSFEKSEKLKQEGISAYLFDKDIPLEDIWDINTVNYVLISIPPDTEQGDLVLGYNLKKLFSFNELRWLGYLSTTGVYGNHDGGWVDENTEVNSADVRLRNRIQAEKDWLSSGLPVHIFRLSGIYGKGRSVIDSLKKGVAKRIRKEGQVFSRIHVDDIANIIDSSIKNPSSGEIYNCCDDFPASSEEVVTYGAKLLGINPPDVIDINEADLSPMAKSFYSNNRRVSNNKIKEALGVKLLYPDYKSGLEAILKESAVI